MGVRRHRSSLGATLDHRRWIRPEAKAAASGSVVLRRLASVPDLVSGCPTPLDLAGVALGRRRCPASGTSPNCSTHSFIDRGHLPMGRYPAQGPACAKSAYCTRSVRTRPDLPTGPRPAVSRSPSPSSLFSPAVHQIQPVDVFFRICEFFYLS